MEIERHRPLAQPSAVAVEGDRRVSLRRELSSDRVFAVEEVLAGIGPARLGGPPGDVERVRVRLERTGVSREAVIQRDGWLAALPPHAGFEPVTVSFHREDGSVWESIELESLADMLGPQPDAAPDGGGWTVRARVALPRRRGPYAALSRPPPRRTPRRRAATPTGAA